MILANAFTAGLLLTTRLGGVRGGGIELFLLGEAVADDAARRRGDGAGILLPPGRVDTALGTGAARPGGAPTPPRAERAPILDE